MILVTQDGDRVSIDSVSSSVTAKFPQVGGFIIQLNDGSQISLTAPPIDVVVAVVDEVPTIALRVTGNGDYRMTGNGDYRVYA